MFCNFFFRLHNEKSLTITKNKIMNYQTKIADEKQVKYCIIGTKEWRCATYVQTLNYIL